MPTKKVFATIICFFFLSILFAQENDTIKKEENLFENVNLKSINGFGGITNQIAPIGDNINVFTGFCGGVLFNQKIFVGAYGMGLSSDHKINNAVDTLREYLDFNHGGVLIGYNHNPHKLVHLTATSRIGWGHISLHEKNNWEDAFEQDKVLVFSPEIGAEINITKWFKLKGEVGYRIVTGIDKKDLYKESDFNKPTTTISLLFGGFNNK